MDGNIVYKKDYTCLSIQLREAANRGWGEGRALPLRKKNIFEARKKDSQKIVATKLDGEVVRP